MFLCMYNLPMSLSMFGTEMYAQPVRAYRKKIGIGFAKLGADFSELVWIYYGVLLVGLVEIVAWHENCNAMWYK